MQCHSCGMGTYRDFMALILGAPFCSLQFPAFTMSWLYLSKPHQSAATFHASLVDGSDEEVDPCLQKNLQNMPPKSNDKCLSIYECNTADDFNCYWAVASLCYRIHKEELRILASAQAAIHLCKYRGTGRCSYCCQLFLPAS